MFRRSPHQSSKPDLQEETHENSGVASIGFCGAYGKFDNQRRKQAFGIGLESLWKRYFLEKREGSVVAEYARETESITRPKSAQKGLNLFFSSRQSVGEEDQGSLFFFSSTLWTGCTLKSQEVPSSSKGQTLGHIIIKGGC